MPDRSPIVTPITGRRSLVKPPFSESLRAGSVTLQPGEAVGEHTTTGREEAIIVLTGVATVSCEGEIFEVKAKHFAYIPPASAHNVINNSTEIVEYAYLVTPVGDPSLGEHSHPHP